MTTMKSPVLFGIALLVSLLAGCQSLQGEREGDRYYSPAAAYGIDLGVNTFRGPVTLDERCDRNGGSTTFWDGTGRMFRVDYLKIDSSPLVQAPRFASDQTLLNLVVNNYLRQVVAPAPLIDNVDVVHREFLQGTTPRSLFLMVSLDMKNNARAGGHNVAGTYYYGFLLFKKGPMIYIVQHRQPALMPDKMKSVLLRLADALTIPGKTRDDTELERTRRLLARMRPGELKQDPVRLCEPN